MKIITKTALLLTLLVGGALLGGCPEAAGGMNNPAGGSAVDSEPMKPAILQGIDVLYDKDTKKLLAPNHLTKDNPLLEIATNQQKYLRANKPLSDLNLYKEGTKIPIAKLKEVGINTYGIEEVDFDKLELGTTRLQEIISGEVFNESKIRYGETDKTICERKGWGWEPLFRGCNQ